MLLNMMNFMESKYLLLTFLIICSVYFFYNKLVSIREPKKIKLILHAGLEKTGTSALQHFFALNTDKLAKQGICYPYVTSQQQAEVPSCGNASGLLERYQQNPQLFDDIYKQATKGKCHTIILSSEIMTLKPEQLYEILKEHKNFETYVILFVREIYGFSWSYYQQDLKFCVGNYRNHDQEIPPLNLDIWLDSSFADSNLILVNYDYCKNKLIETFFKKTLIPVNLDRLNPIKTINRSFTESEHNISEAFWRNGKGAIVNKIANAFILRSPKSTTFRYYDKKFAKALYDHYRHTLIKANLLLVDQHKLPLSPAQPPGYTNVWNKKNIGPQDIEVVLDALNKEGYFINSSLKDLYPKEVDLNVLINCAGACEHEKRRN